ncbi:DUF86 domain-containing protein [Actinomycetota bacterium]|nr:DUF86 domain-containing protein [Actinomycetota bacterium]
MRHPDHNDRDRLNNLLRFIGNLNDSISFYEKTDGRERASHEAAVVRNLEMISEIAKNLLPETKELAEHVPWKQIVGFRNIAAHDYASIDYDVAIATAYDDIPALKKAVESVLLDVIPDDNH